jgi:hypothetical protein
MHKSLVPDDFYLFHELMVASIFLLLDIVHNYHILDGIIFLICNFPFTMNLRGDYLSDKYTRWVADTIRSNTKGIFCLIFNILALCA